ncbi:MAG: hypothetical protein ACR2P4_08060, partial [Gammaproteobacteria bacterium]
MIDGVETLRLFWAEHTAKIAGEMTMKYSQKRLGRGHFGMCKNEEYARELVSCQIALHAAVIADFASLTAEQLQLPDIPPKLRRMMCDIHQTYAATAPATTTPHVPAQLADGHFFRGGGVKELSDKTGALLFGKMPLTEDLLPGNKQIFRGQLRAAYISVLQQFQNRADKPKL